MDDKKKKTASAQAFQDEIAKWPIEKCFDELERIVAQLESQTTSLEDSLQLFEQGMQLSRRCSAELQSVEKRIQLIMETSRGEAKFEDFAGADTETS